MNIAEMKAQLKAVETMSFEQLSTVESMLKTHKRADIAKKIDVSESKLKRAAKVLGWKFDFAKAKAHMKHSKETVEEVISYFEENGISKTKDRFPEIRIRSIIERYKRKKPRQINWTDEQIVQAVRFGPFVSLSDQVAYFNRPLAHEGSIRSLWSKRLSSSRKQIAGFPKYKALKYVNEICPSVKTALDNNQVVYLWSDMENHLKSNCPEFIQIAIEAMTLFQKKLYGENPREEILKIIKTHSSI